jgi:hypothetical protein
MRGQQGEQIVTGVADDGMKFRHGCGVDSWRRVPPGDVLAEACALA